MEQHWCLTVLAGVKSPAQLYGLRIPLSLSSNFLLENENYMLTQDINRTVEM